MLAAAAMGAEGLTAASLFTKLSELKFGAKVLRRVARSPAPTIRMPSLLLWLAQNRERGGKCQIMPLPSHMELANRALAMWTELQAFAAAAMRPECTPCGSRGGRI